MLFTVLKVIAVAYVAYCALVQVKKPDRWAGRLFLWVMNRSHAGVTDWGLSHITIDSRAMVLDIGCGGGRTIQKLAAQASEGRVYGADYATGSVAASRAFNLDLFATGRVAIVRATVSQLPFAAASFDLVTAVETQYYWPDLVNDMREVHRVLKPGGRFLAINELHHRKADEQRDQLMQAGFTDVEVFEKSRGGWICATGRA